MPGISITSTESFGMRAQKSEQRRVILWLAVLIGMAIVTITRRALGGVVMSANRMFYPTMAVYVVAMAVTAAQWVIVRRANREARLLPTWGFKFTGIFDLCVPAALLLIGALESPRGAAPALSSPNILLLSMVIMLSVLRLRPRFTLLMGLGAALFHAMLAFRVGWIGATPMAYDPVYFAYAFVLAFTGIAGMLVAREMRKHVMEATDEATAHERAERNIALINRDLSVAREIQRGLLPSASPKFDGFDIAGLNTPADQTGGDYYDWQELPDGRLIAVMADVTGHGIGPALVMAVCRAYARASSRLIHQPEPLMARLNELISADLPADRFITLAISILSKGGQVELLSAGHGPTLLYCKSTNLITQFHGDGLPLGVHPEEKYGPTAAFDMQSGDVLVMLTDGFFEWQRKGDDEQFGIERLHDTLLTCANQPAADIIKTLDSAVRTFVGNTAQQDDMTVVVIKRK